MCSISFFFSIVDVLSVDKQLANEIEFDLRKFEEEQKETEEQQKRKQQETLKVHEQETGYIYLI
jgi:uncharacterized membrane protein (DUF106 family)